MPTATLDILKEHRYFDAEKANRAVNFFKLLRHTKAEWYDQPFQLQTWQKDKILKPLFGTVWADGTRCFRTAYISTARKNGKTELGAGMALYLLTADGEKGAEIYSAAGDKEQASMVFNAAATMVKLNKSLSKRCRVIASQKRIVYLPTNSFYRVISADADFKHGFNAHAVLYDELHVAKNRELWDVLSTSMKARRQPLMIALTTAGFEMGDSICYELYKEACSVLDGTVYDPTFFAFICEAAKEDNWEDPKTWAKANPGLGNTVKIRDIQSEILKAKNNPALENTFRVLTLNQWMQKHNSWIPPETWAKSAGILDIKKLIGRKCYGGLDLASVSDLAAFVLLFPWDDGSIKMLPTFWVPEENMHRRTLLDRVPYEIWHKQGWLKATPGNVIDFGFIKKDILNKLKLYDVQDINYDKWNSGKLVQELEDEAGRPADRPLMIQISMGIGSLTAPTKEYEVAVRSGKMHHGDNPIMAWMMSNVEIKTDEAGNIKPDKKRSREKIDGVVAAIIAYDRVIRNTNNTGKSLYEKGGIKTL